MPRLTCVGRYRIGGVGVAIRVDDPRAWRPLERLLRAAERLPRAVRPQVTYDLLTAIRRPRLIKNGRSLFSTPHALLVLAGFELELYRHLAAATLATPLHASCVAVGEEGIVLSGPSGAGKTTLALELVGRGARYLAEEHTFLGADGRLSGLPRGIHLEAGLPSTGMRGLHLVCERDSMVLPRQIARSLERAAVVAILDPQRDADEPQPLTPAAAAAQCLGQLHRDVDPASLAAVTRLCASARCVRLAIDGADRAAEALLALARQPPPLCDPRLAAPTRRRG